jgi:site-specific recombinase XerD
MTSFAPLLESFFTDRLIAQRRASPHTVSAYRDTFRLLLSFAEERLKRSPSALRIEDVDARLIGSFLDHLEKKRGNSARTRNARLAAIRSLFHYAATREPAHASQIQRVLAIAKKRFERKIVSFLTSIETEALLKAVDQTTWIGRRDHTLLLVAVQTGLRVSELTGLTVKDVALEGGAHVRSVGKGRKERVTPLTKQSAAALRRWLREIDKDADASLFPSQRGGALSRDAVEHLVKKHSQAAAKATPSLAKKTISPHVLRHTAAVQLLRAGVDRSTIALWLGHEQVETTQMYLDADLTMKERALARTAPLSVKGRRYRPPDRLMAFLAGL